MSKFSAILALAAADAEPRQLQYGLPCMPTMHDGFFLNAYDTRITTSQSTNTKATVHCNSGYTLQYSSSWNRDCHGTYCDMVCDGNSGKWQGDTTGLTMFNDPKCVVNSPPQTCWVDASANNLSGGNYTLNNGQSRTNQSCRSNYTFQGSNSIYEIVCNNGSLFAATHGGTQAVPFSGCVPSHASCYVNEQTLKLNTGNRGNFHMQDGDSLPGIPCASGYKFHGSDTLGDLYCNNGQLAATSQPGTLAQDFYGCTWGRRELSDEMAVAPVIV